MITILNKLQKALKNNPSRTKKLIKELLQNTEQHKLLALLASQPVLWTALAPLLLQHTDAKAGEPVFAPAVFKPFGLDYPLSQLSDTSLYYNFNFVDIDNDGDKDFFLNQIVNPNNGNVDTAFILFYKNNGTKELPKFNTPFIRNPFNIPNIDSEVNPLIDFAFYDFDNDGDNDLMFQGLDIIANDTFSAFFYSRNIGTPASPNFTSPIKNPFGLSSNDYGASPHSLVDFDNDGDVDIIMLSSDVLNTYVSNGLTYSTKYQIIFFKNIGTKTSPNFQKIILLDDSVKPINNHDYLLTYLTGLNVVDYDRDGDLDIVNLGFLYEASSDTTLIDYTYKPGIIFRNNGNPLKPFNGFEDLKNIYTPTLFSEFPESGSFLYNALYKIIGLSDLDNDGDRDIIVHTRYDTVVKNGNEYDVSNFFFLENLGHANNTIAGKVYLDKNKNNTQDVGEKNLPNLVINYDKAVAPAVKSLAITDSAGNFLFPALDGSYVLKPTVPKYHTSVPAQATINTADTNFYYTQNFAIQPINTTTADLVGYITSGPTRPGFKVPFWLTYKNVGTKAMTGSMVFTKDNRLSFVTASTSPNSQSGNNLTWNFSNLQPMESVTIYAEMQLPPSATLGDTLKNIIQITPLSGDSAPLDNNDTLQTKIVGSFDPNDKLVTPTGTGSEGHISPSTGLFEYTVRFQNTGTDTAFNVVVKDSLGTNFDWSTLQILSSSHPVTSVVRNTSTLKFTFDNILLPASIQNEPKSHGFVKYSIQPKASQPVGSRFTNNANIFFDYNSPIVTNTTVNTFFVSTALTGKQNQTFELFPNPMNDRAILRFDNIYGEEFQFTLYSLNGNVVDSRSVSGGSLEIERKSLAPGIYVFKLEGAQTMGTGRIVVQ
jgi:hypothetical protein